MNDGLDRVLRDFVMESQENLDRLDHEFVALEQDPSNTDLLADIFRIIHTIKGSAGFLSLVTLEQVSHYAEDVLSKLREGALRLNSDITTVLLSAVDTIKSILLTIEKTGQEGEHEVEPVLKALKSIAEKSRSAVEEAKAAKAPAPEKPAPVPQISKPNRLQDLSAMHEEPSAHLAGDASSKSASEIIERTLSSVEESRIHVDVALLDQLMNLTAELVLARNQVMQLSTRSEERSLRDIAQRMNVVVTELQETVMKTRMQPIKKVFGMFPRLVRDLSMMQGKNVQLVMEGQATELDKTLIEAIKDPLTHLVRNAIDHGVEASNIRERLGKSPTAKIQIRAFHEAGLVHIEVADDGAGVDVQRVKAKAIQQGLLTPQQAEEMAERQLVSLIFRPGFSTAEQITKISGRGVGMDVVKRNLDRIGGTIDVQTELHKGTTMKLRVPITLAIIPVLIVVAGKQRFAIPQVNLEELIMLQTDDDHSHAIERIYGAEVYRLRGELLPIIRLRDIFALPKAEDTLDNLLNIVVLSAGELHFGLVVDDVGDTEEIVVKPLSSHIKQLPYYDGATIMGDGGISLILNTAGLYSSVQLSSDDIKKAEQQGNEQTDEINEAEIREHRQTIVLFRVGNNEFYGVPLAFVVRLEEFSAAQIEYSGGREVMQYRHEILPLIRLEQYFNIPAAPPQEILSLIVFAVEKQIGLVVSEIVNTVEIDTHIDTETFKQKGILGSTIIDGHSVMILDIHGLIELAYPTWYKKFFVSKITEEERNKLDVLIVEDSMFFLNIEKSYLEAAGYHVITAVNGKDAQEKLTAHHVDVVVTDLDMPYCNGFELAKIIKSTPEWKHLPVMALTSLSGEEDRRRGFEAGIDEYQIKLDREEVLKSLETVILKKQGRRR